MFMLQLLLTCMKRESRHEVRHQAFTIWIRYARSVEAEVSAFTDVS